jgi:hypothetical protein
MIENVTGHQGGYQMATRFTSEGSQYPGTCGTFASDGEAHRKLKDRMFGFFEPVAIPSPAADDETEQGVREALVEAEVKEELTWSEVLYEAAASNIRLVHIRARRLDSIESVSSSSSLFLDIVSVLQWRTGTDQRTQLCSGEGATLVHYRRRHIWRREDEAAFECSHGKTTETIAVSLKHYQFRWRGHSSLR